MELTVDVSANDDWSSHWYNIRLFGKYFLGLESNRVYLFAECLNFCFW
jgi:hypothetical protein